MPSPWPLGEVLRMSEDTKVPSKGSDWTRLLTDPDLVSHLGQLLQTYREVPPEQREAALLRAMREIKDGAIKTGKNGGRKNDGQNNDRDKGSEALESTPAVAVAGPAAGLQRPETVNEAPPFETDFLSPESASTDRRRFQRMKCYVAVEIHIEGVAEPVWGNLVNVGRGGC